MSFRWNRLTMSLVGLLLIGATPEEKVSELLAEGKAERAAKLCERSEKKDGVEAGMHELCARAAFTVLEDKGEGNNVAALDVFSNQWVGTVEGKAAHDRAGSLSLDAASTEADLEAVLKAYGDTSSAASAAERLRALQWSALAAAPTAARIEAFAQRWDASAGPYPSCARLRANGLPAEAANWCAERGLAGLAGTPTEAALAELAGQWPNTPAASQARERAASTALGTSPDDATLARVASTYAGTAAAATAVKQLDERLARAWAAAVKAGSHSAPDGAGGAISGLPSSALIAILRSGVPMSGTYKDPSNWRATFSSSTESVTVTVSDLVVSLDKTSAPTAPGDVPAALTAYLGSLDDPTWKATSAADAPKAWSRIGVYGDRAFYTGVVGTNTWLRLVDPVLHAQKTWTFKHTLGKLSSALFQKGTARSLPREGMFVAVTDGVVALNACKVVPLDCEGDDVVEATACVGQAVSPNGGPAASIAGLGREVGIDASGRIGENYARGAVNGYCYDVVENATWKEVTLDAGSWRASAPVGPPAAEVSASSIQPSDEIPPELQLSVSGEDEWCGDVTVYNPGVLTVRKGGAVLSRRAISASAFGRFYLVTEVAECATSSFVYDAVSKERAVVDSGSAEAGLRLIGNVAGTRASDFAAKGRFASCRLQAGGSMLFCGDPLKTVYDGKAQVVVGALDGLTNAKAGDEAGPAVAVVGKSGARWLLHGRDGIVRVGPIVATTSIGGVGQDGRAVLSTPKGSGMVMEVWDGVDLKEVATFGKTTSISDAREGSAGVRVDLDLMVAVVTPEVWSSRAGGGGSAGGVIDLRTGTTYDLVAGVTDAKATQVAALRAGTDVHILAADGVTWHVMHASPAP